MTGNRRPLTQSEVEGEIARLSDAMEDAMDELARRAQGAADAEADYKVAYAKELLKAGTLEGSGPRGRTTVDEREALALGKVEDLFRARLISEAHHNVAQERLRTQRSQIDALRTIAANIRAQT